MTYFNYYFTFTRCGTSKDVYFKTSVSILLFSELDFKVSSSVLTCGDNNRKDNFTTLPSLIPSLHHYSDHFQAVLTAKAPREGFD